MKNILNFLKKANLTIATLADIDNILSTPYHKLMDQTSPTQGSAEPQGAGLLEIILAGIVITLLLGLGILNYFNILSVSGISPKYLGWLPRREVPTGTSRQTTQQEPLPTPSPNLTFQYDTKKAEALLTQYIKDNIKPEFLPEKIEIKQSFSIDGRQEDKKYEFGSQFTLNKDAFSANFHYKENTNEPNDFVIFLQPADIQDAAITPSIANSMASSYFNNPYLITSCRPHGQASLCETFRSENEEKRGYGLISANDRRKFAPFLFTCSMPKTSKDYASQKTCIDL